jgi:hypothetical protein
MGRTERTKKTAPTGGTGIVAGGGGAARRAAFLIAIAATLCAVLFALGVIAMPRYTVWDDGHGNIYSGNIMRGAWSGEVRIEYSDGSEYVGTLKDGHWDGYGIYRSADGEEYSGKFTDGKPE